MTATLIYVGFHAALLASVYGVIRFAVRALKARDQANARCASIGVWRGAAGLANDRARQAENAVRLWRHIAETSIETTGTLLEALEGDVTEDATAKASTKTMVH